MKNFSKLGISILFLSLLLVFSSLPALAFSGSGTQESPYIISSQTDLEQLAADVNEGTSYEGEYFELTQSISLTGYSGATSWTPIGTWTRLDNVEDSLIASNPFSGTFDGKDNTISGLYINDTTKIYEALFGYIGKGGVIENLTVEGEVSGDMFMGGIVARNYGLVTNCINRVNVTGIDNEPNNSVNPDDPDEPDDPDNPDEPFYEEIDTVGGVVSVNLGSIEDCKNYGGITGNGNTGNNAGGIVGSNNEGSVINSSNYGTISGTSALGGIAGINLNNATIDGSFNEGNVTSEVAGVSLGGIVGEALDGSISTSYNNGIITGWSLVGGIVGNMTDLTQVNNCYNTGSVSGEDNHPQLGSNGIGGIAGQSGGTIENSYNIGILSGDSSVGGIVGVGYYQFDIKDPEVYATVSNCYYLDTSATTASGTNEDRITATSASTTQFKSGEICWLLQDQQESLVWGQTISTNDYPILNPESNQRVWQVTFNNISETSSINIYVNNDQSIVDLPVATPPAGNVFLGWSTTADSDTIDFDSKTSVTNNLTLYPVFADQYTVNVAVYPDGAGTATGAGTFNLGKNCTIEATANDGYVFENWTLEGSDEPVSSDNLYTFTQNVPGTYNYVANFKEVEPEPPVTTYKIDVEVNPVGAGTVTGGGTYNSGQSFTLNATANTGYKFVSWTLNDKVEGTDSTLTGTATGNVTYTANFEDDTTPEEPETNYNLLVSVSPQGSGSVSVLPDLESYSAGSEVTLTANANSGYKFAYWNVSGNLIDRNPYTFEINEDTTAIAVFERVTNNNPGNGGNTNPPAVTPPTPDEPGTPDDPGTPDTPDEPEIPSKPENGFTWWVPGAEDDSNTTPPSEEREVVTVYRLYNIVNDEHLYTTNLNEVSALTANSDWRNEGPAWEAPKTGVPVYRLYNSVTGLHLYTTDTNEVSVLTQNGWSADNNGTPVFYSGGDVPVYRLYNPATLQHLLTTDSNEYQVLGEQGWIQEGIALYAVSNQ